LQDVVESIESRYSIENLEKIITDLKDKGLNSTFYKESKIDHDLPRESVLKASILDVTKKPF
ncbi:hypothetical protein KYD79_26810, partial [Escherichia coli]|nr:hypothetical protein [Escherichia coli]